MIEAAISAARDAGRIIEERRRAGVSAEAKGKAGPVTEADRAADAFLKTRLLEIAPIGWLSEETADDLARLDSHRLWVVDPLDGTKEFIEGIPQYVVAIALVEKGTPVLGVVHNPATGDTFWAERGSGAYHGETRIRVRESDIVLASRSETRRGEFEPFESAWQVRPVGSIELKLALVAAGQGAVTLSRGPKHEWDVCAGALIVQEAGGRATDLFGKELVFNQSFPKTRGVLAGAPEAYERALALVREIGASGRMQEEWKRQAE